MTYRGAPYEILKGVKIGETFRLIQFVCSSENLETAMGFRGGTELHSTQGHIIEFEIEESCFNAGKLNEIGVSLYPDQQETLIPPYSVVTYIRRDGNIHYLKVEPDNKKHDLHQSKTIA